MKTKSKTYAVIYHDDSVAGNYVRLLTHTDGKLDQIGLYSTFGKAFSRGLDMQINGNVCMVLSVRLSDLLTGETIETLANTAANDPESASKMMVISKDTTTSVMKIMEMKELISELSSTKTLDSSCESEMEEKYKSFYESCSTAWGVAPSPYTPKAFMHRIVRSKSRDIHVKIFLESLDNSIEIIRRITKDYMEL